LNTPLESATRDQIAAAVAEIVSAAVAEIAENRAVIDQAKGMLILLYGVDDQTAFDTLTRHSQNTNIELRPSPNSWCLTTAPSATEKRTPVPLWCTAKR
jgi:hypothetical protein